MSNLIVDTCGLCALPLALIRSETQSTRLGMQGELHMALHKAMPLTWWAHPAARRLWARWDAA